MSDHSIRPLTPQESAERAAALYMETGTDQPCPFPNPSKEAGEWHSVYFREILKLSAEKEGVLG